MILHEYYFSNLRPAVELMPPPGSKLANALTETFGSVDQWRIAFQAIAAMRGVGVGNPFSGCGHQPAPLVWETFNDRLGPHHESHNDQSRRGVRSR